MIDPLLGQFHVFQKQGETCPLCAALFNEDESDLWRAEAAGRDSC